MAKFKAFLLIVVGVFISSAGPIFISNGLDIFKFSMSTWQIIISAGIFGVMGYIITVMAPYTITPGAEFKLPVL